MGSGVTSTIRSGVANLKSFTNTPDLLAYGQLCAVSCAQGRRVCAVQPGGQWGG